MFSLTCGSGWAGDGLRDWARIETFPGGDPGPRSVPITDGWKPMSVDLGMPATPPAPLAARRPSRQLMVGNVPVGGGAPVSVQSMCTTLTANVNATLQQ